MIRFNLVKPSKLASVGFTRADMLKVGAKVIDTIQKRVSRGQNLKDKAAKPLGPKYKAKKEAKGQPGIRNLMYSGSMLGAMTIVEADDKHVTIGFTRQSELVKAQQNQARDRWFGISRNDEAIISRYAESVLEKKLKTS